MGGKEGGATFIYWDSEDVRCTGDGFVYMRGAFTPAMIHAASD